MTERRQSELEPVSPPNAARESTPFADQLLDELLPEELEWRRVVVDYPIASLTVAAVGGYVLGRASGSSIVAALGAFASATVVRNINSLVGEDIL